MIMTTLTLIEATATDAANMAFMCKAHHSEMDAEIEYYVRVDEADYHLTKQMLDQIFDEDGNIRQDIVLHPYVEPTEAELVAEALPRKLDEIEMEYNTRLNENIEYTGYTFQADKASRTILTEVLIAADDTFSTYWLTADNQKVSMTFAELKGLSNAILFRGQQLFERKTELKTLTRSATTFAELDAITW